MPCIDGYEPRSNHQALLAETVIHRVNAIRTLQDIAAADADRPMAVPEVDDILLALVPRPVMPSVTSQVRRPAATGMRLTTSFIEREAGNRSLGAAGELFALNFERARLVHAERGDLAHRIEHTSQLRGDHEGYDILSFDADGAERLIEFKTTQHGDFTPFYVSRNQVLVSAREAPVPGEPALRVPPSAALACVAWADRNVVPAHGVDLPRVADVMRIATVRRHALSLPGAVEAPHFDHASFRVGRPHLRHRRA